MAFSRAKFECLWKKDLDTEYVNSIKKGGIKGFLCIKRVPRLDCPIKMFRSGHPVQNTKEKGQLVIWHSEADACEKCAAKNGLILYAGEMNPLHPNCRCKGYPIDENSRLAFIYHSMLDMDTLLNMPEDQAIGLSILIKLNYLLDEGVINAVERQTLIDLLTGNNTGMNAGLPIIGVSEMNKKITAEAAGFARELMKYFDMYLNGEMTAEEIQKYKGKIFRELEKKTGQEYKEFSEFEESPYVPDKITKDGKTFSVYAPLYLAHNNSDLPEGEVINRYVLSDFSADASGLNQELEGTEGYGTGNYLDGIVTLVSAAINATKVIDDYKIAVQEFDNDGENIVVLKYYDPNDNQRFKQGLHFFPGTYYGMNVPIANISKKHTTDDLATGYISFIDGELCITPILFEDDAFWRYNSLREGEDLKSGIAKPYTPDEKTKSMLEKLLTDEGFIFDE